MSKPVTKVSVADLHHFLFAFIVCLVFVSRFFKLIVIGGFG